MTINIIEKGPITIIGREGHGDGARGGQWVPRLWREFQLHISELAPLVKHEADGKPSGIWGAMSDSARRFMPWESDGYYLAGCEVEPDAIAPAGWAKWVLPPCRYLVADCTPQTYGAVFQEILWRHMPEHNQTLVGAVHEFYDPQASDGRMLLYFPIERL